MNAPLSPAAAVEPSGIRAIATAAWQIPEVVHLEFGEPDFDTPAHVVDAAHRAAVDGATRYGPSAGLPRLREAVVAKLARDNGIDIEPGRVVVTAGGVGALHAAYRATLDAGDEVLVPDPGWPNLVNLASMVSAVPVRYPLDADHRPDWAALDRLRTWRTRAIVVNSPSNPLGAVWSSGVQERLGEWARRHGLWVIADECYDQLWLDEPAVPFHRSAPDASVISVYSTSKTYAMTGWRVGYAVGPASAVALMCRFQETVASCVNTVAQHAAVAALTGPQQPVDTMRAAYRSRRDEAVRLAARLGLSVSRPSGAFYLWTRLPAGVDDTGFALDLLRDKGVATAPGSAFGPRGRGHLRVSLAAAPDHIRLGLTRMAEYLSTVDERSPSTPRNVR